MACCRSCWTGGELILALGSDVIDAVFEMCFIHSHAKAQHMGSAGRVYATEWGMLKECHCMLQIGGEPFWTLACNTALNACCVVSCLPTPRLFLVPVSLWLQVTPMEPESIRRAHPPPRLESDPPWHGGMGAKAGQCLPSAFMPDGWSDWYSVLP